jgi:hypothetical protein
MNTRWVVVLGCGLLVAGAGLMLAGCESEPFLAQRTVPERPEYGKDVIPVTHVDIRNPDPRGPGGGVVWTDVVRGTWTFGCPPNMTQTERRTGNFDQYSIYVGRPQPQDVPFVVITVSRDRRNISEGAAEYKITGRREYVLNGNVAQEWSGQMTDGAGFCELIVRRPGTAGEQGDVCRAMAIVKTEEQQKAATEILQSIKWEAQP